MRNILKSVFILISVLFLASLATNSYFTDQAQVAGNTFQTGTWPTTSKVVINEVYYDVDGSHGSEPNDEWIELYNPESYAVSLKDWTITDNTTTITIHAEKSIPAGGFALISKDHSTWSLYWSVPAGVEIVELGSTIGGGLSNSGDRVILKDASANLIDQMSWSTNNTVFDPPCPDVAEGHSLERNPKGHDTDVAADFINQINPTPGVGLLGL